MRTIIDLLSPGEVVLTASHSCVGVAAGSRVLPNERSDSDILAQDEIQAMQIQSELTHGGEPRLELARRLYREYYITCFWHMKQDLEITEAAISSIIRGLEIHGGIRGMHAAAQLIESRGTDSPCP